ncbi:MAG: hypothetical protein II135_01655, partial [Clostridia bacterium]|nr:hypothetical protein [Clostridia bacterium]
SEDEETGDEIKTAVSCFMDPAYLTQMVGIAFIPNDNFSQRVAFANRMTISHGYGYADDPDRVYGMKYKNRDIRFKISGKVAVITEII